MNPLLAALLVSAVAAHGPAVPADPAPIAAARSSVTTVGVPAPPDSGVLAQSIARAATTWNVLVQAGEPAVQRSWAARHPVLLGAIIGAGAGAGIGYAAGQECTGEEVEPCSSRGGAAAVGAGLGAGAGAIVGAIIAHMSK